MLDSASVKLNDIYKVLNILKASKYVTSKEIADKCNINATYVVAAIRYLRQNGYNIETVQGATGGYIYHGKENIKLSDNVTNKISKGIVDLYRDNVLTKDIKEVTNRNQQTIYYHLRKHRIKPNRKRRNIEEYRQIESLYNKGLSIKEIAKELNIPATYASKLVYVFVKGSRRHKIENREEIKQYIIDNPGITGKDIAKKFNVSEGTITYLKKELKGIRRK